MALAIPPRRQPVHQKIPVLAILPHLCVGADVDFHHIVYDNSDNAELIAMDMTDGATGALPEGVSGRVPAVSISKADGEAMARRRFCYLKNSERDNIFMLSLSLTG